VRSFIIALSILLSAASFSVISSFYVSNSCDELIDISMQFPDEIDEIQMNEKYTSASQKFDKKWNKSQEILEFFIPLEIIEKINEAKNELTSRFFTKDNPGYVSAKQRLIYSLEELKKTK